MSGGPENDNRPELSDIADQATRLGDGQRIETRTSPTLNEKIAAPHIPGYTILDVLGRGGMGVVFKAYDQRLLRHVAIKMVAAGPIATDELLERFQLEAQAVAQLQHPHVAQIYEVGDSEGRPYLVMEFVGGGTLSEQLKNSPYKEVQAAALIETLARAIHACHEAGIIHRDLKPSNILLTREGSPKITDFGLAKRLQAEATTAPTRTGDVVGTPAYMSPEQAGGVVRNVGPATDVYALGVILFEMLIGRPPFHAADPLSTVLMVLSDEPVAPRRLQPSLSRDLETICLKCLEKSPARRYGSAAELADDLARFQRHEPIHARPVSALERAWKLARRRPAAAGLVAVAVLFFTVVVPAIVGGVVWYNTKLRAELDRTHNLFGEAHRLANWLLFDHTEALGKLRGGTPEQKKLVSRMLDYLDALDQQRHQGEVISADIMAADLALAYERIAAVQGDPNQNNLGETRSAIHSYQKALSIRRQLAGERQQDWTRQLPYIAVLVKIADIRAATGSTDQALRGYDDVEKRLAKLRRQFPQQNEIVLSESDLQFRIGDIYLEQNKLVEALRAYENALHLAHQVTGQNPEEPNQRRRLAVIHSRIARVYQEQNQPQQARRNFAEMLAYAERATSNDPHDVLAERDLTVALIGYGDALLLEPNAEQALVSYQRAVDLRRAHQQADPRSASVARDLAVALERLGIAHQYLQHHQPATILFQEALDLFTKLRREDAENRSLARDVCLLHDRLGAVLQATGELPQAEQQFQQGVKLAKELTSSAAPTALDLAVLGQLTVSWAGIQVLLLTPESSAAEAEQHFVTGITGYRQAVEIYDRISQLAPLTESQRAIRETASRGAQQLEENLTRLRALGDDENSRPKEE